MQISSASTPALVGSVLPPPPSLPTEQTSISEPNVVHIGNRNGLGDDLGAYGHESDGDDVLSIPESVGSDDEEKDIPPIPTAGIPPIPSTGIPPPPPLP